MKIMCNYLFCDVQIDWSQLAGDKRNKILFVIRFLFCLSRFITERCYIVSLPRIAGVRCSPSICIGCFQCCFRFHRIACLELIILGWYQRSCLRSLLHWQWFSWLLPNFLGRTRWRCVIDDCLYDYLCVWERPRLLTCAKQTTATKLEAVSNVTVCVCVRMRENVKWNWFLVVYVLSS